MNIERKIDVYMILRDYAEKLLVDFDKINFYTDEYLDKQKIDEQLKTLGIKDRLSELDARIRTLSEQNEYISMAAWNEKLLDKLRALTRYCIKNKKDKDADVARECATKLEDIMWVDRY